MGFVVFLELTDLDGSPEARVRCAGLKRDEYIKKGPAGPFYLSA